MNRYAMQEAQAVAALRAYLALRDAHKHPVEMMLAAIPQHPAARLASAADDCQPGNQ